MVERVPKQEPLAGFEELVEPIKVVEIGCGMRSSGEAHDYGGGRIYDLPHVYAGIEREEELVDSTHYLDEDKKAKARAKAVESGIIFGNAADLPFEDESIDVVTMRSVFGQFTSKDYRELDNIRWFGLMEAFRVLKPGGIIDVCEENTPWEEDDVFRYLNAVGFAVTDYKAMRKDWREPERRDWRGRADGDFLNVYAPDNEPWFKKLSQFYAEEFGSGFRSVPRQYVMVGQKQQPATVERTMEWHEWSVSKDKYNHRDSESTTHQKTYKYGEPVKQEHLPGMYAVNGYYHDQVGLFYMPPKHFF
jgi:ubiquinone/menaquinone biosynthesis C-methylase UbiE